MTIQESQIARLEARLPLTVHTLLKRAAEIQGRTLTDFVVSVASEAAKKTIEETEIINLSVHDQSRIADLLLNPPAPAPALVRAAKKYSKLIKQQ